jgi:two-component system NtrC family sensor kinase
VRNRFFSRFQVRVTIAFLLVSVVPLIAVSMFSLRTADLVITSIVTNELENVAAEKQALLERWISERRADLAVVAGSAAVATMDVPRIAAHLDLVQRQYGVYDRFVIAGPDGRTLYDTAGTSGPTCRAEVWYQLARERQPYMSEVRLAAEGRGSAFLLSVPVPGAGDSVGGVVCATVNTRAILGQVLRVSLGETGECYLVDRTGTFLAHKEPQRILKENIAQSESFTNVFGEGRRRPVYTDYRGVAVLGASRPVANTPWYVVVEQDRDEAFAGSRRLKRNIYVLIAATVAAAIGLSWLLAGYVTAPVRSLSEAAHGLARGEFDHPLLGARPTRPDEIGALYAAFQHMAGQLKDRHARLENRVGLTEAELRKVETQLKGTLEAAARSERLAALGRLASGVAHEIRTPLTSLKLFLQSVQDEIAISPEQSEDYRIAMRQVARIETTINHFLDFARPQEPVMTEVDFAALVDDALEVVQPRANQQEVEIEKRVAADLPRVRGDVRQLGEVLVNLLVNALEAMPEGGRLGIAVVPEPAEPADLAGAGAPAVRVDVSDTGPGIRESDVDRLFEPFFTTKAAGSGLGLAITSGIVERHGGSVAVHTRPGAGTRFSVRLPAAGELSTPKEDNAWEKS